MKKLSLPPKVAKRRTDGVANLGSPRPLYTSESTEKVECIGLVQVENVKESSWRRSRACVEGSASTRVSWI